MCSGNAQLCIRYRHGCPDTHDSEVPSQKKIVQLAGQPFIGICINTEGSYGCKCMPGYDGDGFVCDNLDECGTPDEDCDPLATCVGSSLTL